MRCLQMLTILATLSWRCPLAHPLRPLNERSTDLAWQSRLQDDQARRATAAGLGILRRRITAKSIFDAPTFRPECAEGYEADPATGLCTKKFKINEQAHENFLAQRLNEQFGGEDYEEDEEEEEEEEGPVHFTIPLGDNGYEVGETEVTMVVNNLRSSDVGESDGNEPTGVEATTVDQLSTTTLLFSEDSTTPPTTTTDGGEDTTVFSSTQTDTDSTTFEETTTSTSTTTDQEQETTTELYEWYHPSTRKS